MADISDVEQAVSDLVISVLYPQGPSQSCVVGTLCRVYRGWPNSSTLNSDLSSGAVNVSISTDNDSGRPTTRYLPQWRTTASQPGVAASTQGQAITISGTPAVGDVIGAIVDMVPFAYRIQAGDTPELVASNLNRSIQTTRLTTIQGPNIAIPNAVSIIVRVVCDGTASFESRRQEKDLRIICWCPAPLIRDMVAATIDMAINQVEFLQLPDLSEARIAYRNTASYDQAQNALLYRRDLIYNVEYPTNITVKQPSMLFGASDLNGNAVYG
jgi:hypothetical protein